SSYNLIPGLSGAKKRSFDHPYIAAKVIACPLAAENSNDTDSPGMITGELPLFWNVPDSTKGLEFSTFSMVMVDVNTCMLLSSSSHAVIMSGNTANDSQATCLHFMIKFPF